MFLLVKCLTVCYLSIWKTNNIFFSQSLERGGVVDFHVDRISFLAATNANYTAECVTAKYGQIQIRLNKYISH